MKKKCLFFILTGLAILAPLASATNLVQVYQQALISDPVYQQAIAQELATSEGVPINRAALFPNLSATVSPSLQKALASGHPPYKTTTRAYTAGLTFTQTIFNVSQFTALAGAKATAKQAVATLNATAQNLIIRVAQAYFTVLQDEDTLRANESAKAAYAKQLEQVTQEYKVGLKTITDVYTTRASYDSSVANYIAAKNQLAKDKENLSLITGVLYPNLATLSNKFPMMTPKPADVRVWVATAQQQNWSIKAAQYAVEAARENIKQQFAGHLPTLNVQGGYDINYAYNMGGNSYLGNNGASQVHTSSVGLNLSIPIFEGGQVVSQTNQAKYNYQLAAQQLEQQVRSTVNLARQSFLDVTSGISKIAADSQAIKSARSSLRGMEAGYRVGTQTLVDVLNQQQNVFQAEVQYATDRYAYVNSLLALKQAAGTLSPHDLEVLNSWLKEQVL